MPTKVRGFGSVFLRGRTYWIQYYVQGVRQRESAGTIRKGDAARLLQRRLAEASGGMHAGGGAVRAKFEDLVSMLREDYDSNKRKSRERIEVALRKLTPFFMRLPVREITAARIVLYTKARQREGAAAATINYELACLRRSFSLAMQVELVDRAPHISLLSLDNARKGFFEPEEYERVEAELPPSLRPLMRFLYLTGWRVGEALALTWANVDLVHMLVRLEPGTTKNRDGREFPFASFPQLDRLLGEQREHTVACERATQAKIDMVFHRNGKPIVAYAKAWRAACARAGVAGRLVHDMRRTAVRNLERAAVPRSVAMRLTGHKTEAVYRRYAISSAADLARGVEKLAALHEVEATNRGHVGENGHILDTIAVPSEVIVGYIDSSNTMCGIELEHHPTR